MSDRNDEPHYRAVQNAIASGQVWHGTLTGRRKDGTLYEQEATISPVRDAEGVITHYVAVKRDITERLQTQARIWHLAHHDALTDLPNRVLFQDRLQQAVAQARRSGLLVAILFIDLDNFKDVNDALGHEFGDLLLKAVTLRLRGCTRETDTVARLGGDEFALIHTGLGALPVGSQAGGKGAGAAVRAVLARGSGGAHQRQHRGHDLPARPRRSAADREKRRHGDVPGEEHWPLELPVLQRGNEPRFPGPQGAGA